MNEIEKVTDEGVQCLRRGEREEGLRCLRKALKLAKDAGDPLKRDLKHWIELFEDNEKDFKTVISDELKGLMDSIDIFRKYKKV